MVQPLSREQVRSIDKIAIEQFGIPGVVLMENAGRGAADIITSISPPGLVTILCGKGNNGGDGFVIARHLQIAGHDVEIISLADIDDLTGDASINALIAQKSDIPIYVGFTSAWIQSSAIVIDCLLGTGATGRLRGLYATVIENANQLDAFRIAIDVPTGLDCDTGQASDPTFHAGHTITFVAAKIGFMQRDAKKYVGEIHEVGIGVPKKLLDQFA